MCHYMVLASISLKIYKLPLFHAAAAVDSWPLVICTGALTNTILVSKRRAKTFCTFGPPAHGKVAMLSAMMVL